MGISIRERICVRMYVCECVCACSQFKTTPSIPRKQKKRKGPKASNSFVNKCKNNCQNCSSTSDFELFPSIFPETQFTRNFLPSLQPSLSLVCLSSSNIIFQRKMFGFRDLCSSLFSNTIISIEGEVNTHESVLH